ncbi:MAG: DUF4097 family beta strand repeat-containing protein [Paenibacillus sp.]|uniref:DUF4097 family beta strand repeat-containing protein n=1 Tax=Paenibacillus sp. TaxID=58172 RepID=UPI002912BB07|nr:DUF4097 family beta strand repeat-containing protein [Paenibacillus sp.]MDU4697430.1 DUF4097 family beta strand repeat-containing protein [Paenibacillus sp.]
MTPDLKSMDPRPSQTRTKGYQPRRRKRKLIACLLSALLPGLGHLYLSLYLRGLSFMYFVLIDASALIYFSSVRMAINVPLLIWLGLLIPGAYFFSIYDVLQSTDAHNARLKKEHGTSSLPVADPPSGRSLQQGIGAGALLIGGGAVLFMFRMKPFWLQLLVQYAGVYLVAVALVLAALLLILRESKRAFLRSGRLTAAALLLAVAVILLRDAIMGRDEMQLLIKWWPMVFVLWGIEHILILAWNSMKKTQGRRRPRVDVKGLLLSMFMAFSVFAITQQDQYMHVWNRVSLDLTAAGSEYSAEEGYRVEKPHLDIPINLGTERIVVDGMNGDIEVRKAEIDHVIVRYIVWIDQLGTEDARKIAAVTSVEVNEGKTLGLSVKDKAYGESGRRHPRVNITLIVPENRFLDLDITTSNGGITLTGVQTMKQAKLQTGNGDLRLWDVIGDVSAKTLNGDVEMYRIFGEAQVDTQGGNIKGRGITGKVAMSTLVGDITLTEAQDGIQARTKNGNIRVDGVPRELQAESLNGKIYISSRFVGGDWDVYSAVGELRLELPETGNYELEGSSGYGDIFTELPFAVDRKEIHGTLGSGDYKLKIDGNSDLYVNKS